MNTRSLIAPVVLLAQFPAFAEIPVAPAPASVVVQEAQPGAAQVPVATVAPVVRLRGEPLPRTVDSVVVRRQLSIAPRAVAVVPAPADEVVKTTKTTTVVETPGLPTRVYNSERSVVQVDNRELTYVTVPVLFVVDTAKILDAESAAALQQMAAVIREIAAAEPNAVFDIEGHTSTEGTAEHNLALSAERAQRVYDELTQHYLLPPSLLSAHGYGENYPSYPNGAEEQLQLDRRVLLVRTK